MSGLEQVVRDRMGIREKTPKHRLDRELDRLEKRIDALAKRYEEAKRASLR